MKRDLDLIRLILLASIETPEGERIPDTPKIAGYKETAVRYHIHLMKQAGLVDASDVTSSDSLSPEAILHSITWAGHDFADLSKSPDIWEQGKSAAASAGGVTLDIFKEILKGMVRDQLVKRGILM